MAYVDSAYYLTEFFGDPVVPATDFSRYASRASDMIDIATRYQIVQAGGLSALPAWTQALIKKATCAQINYYVDEGLEVSLDGASAGTGFTVGKVSVQAGAGTSNASASGSGMICPGAIAYLEQTGLLSPSVSALDRWWP